MTARERWGYVLWGVVGLMIAIAELTAAFWSKAPWPTISSTVGHLEELWTPTAVLVVAAIVVVTAHAVRDARSEASSAAAPPRTAGGRIARRPVATAEDRTGAWAYAYLAGTVLCVAVPSVLVGLLVDDTGGETTWVLGYVIYGLTGFFCVVVPSILAYVLGKDVPFPTLFRTLKDLQQRWHGVAMVVLAGLVVLLIHLAFFPWPDISHQPQLNTPTTPTLSPKTP